MESIFFHWPRCGLQWLNEKWRNASFDVKYVAIQTMPITIEISVDSAAPATPYACPVTQPKIRNGASNMLMITVADATTMPGLKFPVPRSAAPIEAKGNWSAIAGMNHIRYWLAALVVAASAPIARAYDMRPVIATRKNNAPATHDSACDWLNRCCASARSFRPHACDITVVVPTPSI